MSNTQLPGLDISLDQAMITGFSGGAWMAAQMAVAYPDLFGCASILNGGLPGTGERLDDFIAAPNEGTPEFLESDEFKQYAEQDWKTSSAKMEDFASRDGFWADQNLLRNQRTYIFGGVIDASVHPVLPTNLARYFKEKGADVKFEMDPQFEHWFRDMTIAGETASHCFQHPDPKYYNNYELNDDYLKNGYLQKFDQFEFVKEKGLESDALRLNQWGFVYYPERCRTSRCQTQMILHGSMEGAERYAGIWGPMADRYGLIMVFPQVSALWDVNYETAAWGMANDDGTYDDAYSRDGPQMRFLEAIMRRLAEPRDAAKYDYDYKKRAYEHGTAYDELTYFMPFGEMPNGEPILMEPWCKSEIKDNGLQGTNCTANMKFGDEPVKNMSYEEMYAMKAELTGFGGEEGGEGEKEEGSWEMDGNGMSVTEDADGRLVIEMWTANALQLATGVAVGVSAAMSLI